MRTETRTRMMPQHYNVYIADDGTEFSSSFECENYEEGQKKIVVEGVIWYDRHGNVLPLTIASWEEVAAIHCEDNEANQNLYDALAELRCNMDTTGYMKVSAYGDSPVCYGQPYLLLYNSEEETWEDVGKTYDRIKKWLDII